MEFNEEKNCNTCKHGYFTDFSSDGWHSLCGIYNCYLCAEQWESCNDYEKGEIPEGTEKI